MGQKSTNHMRRYVCTFGAARSRHAGPELSIAQMSSTAEARKPKARQHCNRRRDSYNELENVAIHRLNCQMSVVTAAHSTTCFTEWRRFYTHSDQVWELHGNYSGCPSRTVAREESMAIVVAREFTTRRRAPTANEAPALHAHDIELLFQLSTIHQTFKATPNKTV